MALQIDIPGYKSAYARIFALNIDEDNESIDVRFKIYANKNARTTGNMDLRQMRGEVRLNRKVFLGLVLPDAEKAALASKECKADQKAEIAAIEKAIELHRKENKEPKEKIPDLSEEDKRKIRETVTNRHISIQQKKLADAGVGNLLKRFGGPESIKAIAYEHMKKLPMFVNAKDV